MRLRAPTLLVIEDTESQAVLVGVAARRAHPGLTVRTAKHGGEGIAYLAGYGPFADRKANPFPDLVILDLIMPEVDGFAVLKWLGERPEPLDVPVVVVTSSPNDEDEERAFDLGATAVHRKPAELEEFGDMVRTIVHEWIGRGEIIAAHIRESG